MKNPDEIKKALECCFANGEQCGDCPYYPVSCDVELVKDAREYIQQLEAERDAAVADLSECTASHCPYCKNWRIPEKAAVCMRCRYQRAKKFEWRGIQKEE